MKEPDESDIELILERITKLPVGDRATFIDEHCTSDALRDEILERLADLDTDLADFLASPAMALGAIEDQARRTIGVYRLLEKIGEGGFGDVYMARQDRPVRRTVALKILKPGMDSREIIARFESERQALALMSHPNIATVLDSGATESGHPYFAMELVKGTPIVQFCDDRKLSVEERLRLFVTVCRAVQHAHQKGVIHRDLKPSNILVGLDGERAVPKVIDFGVAKAIHQPLTENTLFTRQGQVIGTPAYMSPEQANSGGLDIDTRSDVYSLGVILYELLTGTTPIRIERLRTANLAEIQRMICEEDPQTPSSRVSSLDGDPRTVTRGEATESKSLRRRLRGDLDWIVMRALEKDRTRRYESAGELAADIDRHLQNEPVSACPPRLSYVVGKFARKHRVGLGVAATILALLTISTVVSAYQAVVATQLAKELADAQREERELLGIARDNARLAEERRTEADEAREELRRELYVSYMRLLGPAFSEGNVREMRRMLDATRPGPEESDLRGFEWYYWWRAIHRDERTMQRASAGAAPNYSLAVSPNQRWITVPYFPNTVLVIDRLRAGRSRLIELEGDPRQSTFSPDGVLLAVGAGASIELFDVTRDWAKARTLRLGDGFYEAHLEFSPSGDVLAAASGELQGVHLWSTDDWSSTRLDLGGGPVTSDLDYSPDGRLLAYATGEDRPLVWIVDVGTETAKLRLSGHRGRVESIDWSPDGDRLATGDVDGRILVWDRDGEEVYDLATSGAVSVLAHSPDGKHLVASAKDTNTVDVWEAGSGELVESLRGHTQPVTGLAFVGDANTLWTTSRDSFVKTWKIGSAAPPRSHALGAASRDFLRPVSTDLAHWRSSSVLGVISISGRNLALAHVPGGKILRWDLGEPIAAPSWAEDEYAVTALSDDGLLLATARADGLVRVWECASESLREERRVAPSSLTFAWSAALSRDGRVLAVAREERDRSNVAVFDLEQGVERVKLDRSNLLELVLTADGGHLVTRANVGFTVECWALDGGEARRATEYPTQVPTRSLALSPDGRQVAAGCWDNTIRLYDRETGELEAQLEGHVGQVTALSYSRDGRALLSGSTDKTLRIWSTERRALLTTITGHRGLVERVAFTTDGLALFSASVQDGQLRVWPRATEEESLQESVLTLSEAP